MPTWTASQQNSKAGILFDGTDDNLITGVTQSAKTIFTVYKSSAASRNYAHLFGANSGGDGYHGGYDTLQWIDASAPAAHENWINSVSVTPSTLTKPTTYKLLTIRNETAINMYQIGWGQGNFSGRSWYGGFCEIMFLGIEASDALRAQIETDINSRWACY